jgi:hypothetical protein
MLWPSISVFGSEFGPVPDLIGSADPDPEWDPGRPELTMEKWRAWTCLVRIYEDINDGFYKKFLNSKFLNNFVINLCLDPDRIQHAPGSVFSESWSEKLLSTWSWLKWYPSMVFSMRMLRREFQQTLLSSHLIRQNFSAPPNIRVFLGKQTVSYSAGRRGIKL